MFIIADQRIPEQAKNNLELYGNVLFMRPNEITYSSISGHPDIFFCAINGRYKKQAEKI